MQTGKGYLTYLEATLQSHKLAKMNVVWDYDKARTTIRPEKCLEIKSSNYFKVKELSFSSSRSEIYPANGNALSARSLIKEIQ